MVMIEGVKMVRLADDDDDDIKVGIMIEFKV